QSKIALITGGAGAIGSATARAFAREGATVVITDANAAGASAATDGVAFLQQDVTRDEDWTRVIAEVIGRHGRLDILVNNAGILGTTAQNPENVTMEEWHRVTAVNVDGVVLGCKYAIAAMRDRGGVIVNLS